MNRYRGGLPIAVSLLTLVLVCPLQAQILVQPFFPERLYDLYQRELPIDGALLGPGYSGAVPRAAAREAAVARFLNVVATHGIPEGQVTRAIFEGLLSFDMRDLMLVKAGLSPLNQCDGWNRRFGSALDMGRINTIHKGQWVVRNGRDYLVARSISDVSYAEAVTAAGGDSRAIDATLARENTQFCPAEYFNFERIVRSPTDPNKDYALLRAAAGGPRVTPTCGPLPPALASHPLGNFEFAAKNVCLPTLTPQQTMFASGAANALAERCDSPGGAAGTSLRQFRQAGLFVAVGGRGGGFMQAAEGASHYTAGANFAQRLDCVAGRPLLQGLAWWTEEVAKSSTYVRTCSRRYSNEQCGCMANQLLPMIPNIHLSDYVGDVTIEGILKTNVLLHGSIVLSCGIQ